MVVAPEQQPPVRRDGGRVSTAGRNSHDISGQPEHSSRGAVIQRRTRTEPPALAMAKGKHSGTALAHDKRVNHPTGHGHVFLV